MPSDELLSAAESTAKDVWDTINDQAYMLSRSSTLIPENWPFDTKVEVTGNTNRGGKGGNVKAKIAFGTGSGSTKGGRRLRLRLRTKAKGKVLVSKVRRWVRDQLTEMCES